MKEELPDLAARLQQLHQCQPKKVEAPKNPKGRGEAKGKEKKVTPTGPRKLKLLCLHGYRQSGKAAREKLGSFRKAVSDAFFYFFEKHLNIRLAKWQSLIL